MAVSVTSQNPTLSLAATWRWTSARWATRAAGILVDTPNGGGRDQTPRRFDRTLPGSCTSRRSLRQETIGRVAAVPRTRRPGAARRHSRRGTDSCSSTGRSSASLRLNVAPDAAGFHGRRAVPWALDALNGAVTEPGVGSKPSWYLVATNDRCSARRARAMSSDGLRSSRSRVATRCNVSAAGEVAHLSSRRRRA